MTRTILLVAAFFLLAPATNAQQWCNTCSDSCSGADVVPAVKNESINSFACFNFETEGTGDSAAIDLYSTGLFCLNPADDSDGADTATVWIRKCLGPVSATDFNCGRILGAVLDGTMGATDTQNACIRVGPGRYYVEVATAGNAGENPYVSVEAEE